MPSLVFTDNDRRAFVDARRNSDRQSFGRFLKAMGLANTSGVQRAQAKERFEAQNLINHPEVRRLAWPALDRARGPWVVATTFTLWSAVDRPHGGQQYTIPWHEYGRWHQELTGIVARKGEGLAYNPTSNRDGYRCNASTTEMHALHLDCDGTGDWFDMSNELAYLGFAVLMHRSGGHRPERPKWRMIMPLTAPFSTATEEGAEEWRAIYGTVRTAFGSLGRLSGPGFDPSTDQPHHPWYPGSRRQPEDPLREVMQRPGYTLNLEVLLSGLPTAERPTPHGGRVNVGRNENPSLLYLAFEAAGLLGRDLGNGRHAVSCPWNENHTDPLGTEEDATSSTVIFDGTTDDNLGWFHCSHQGCGSVPLQEVLAALPPEDVAQARAFHREQIFASPSFSLPRLPTLPHL